MAEQNNGVKNAPKFQAANLDFSPVECHKKTDSMNSEDKSNSPSTTVELEEYSLRLVKLLEHDRALDGDVRVSMQAIELPHPRWEDHLHQRVDNSEQIEILFIELSIKMWKGRLPATSIATVNARYSEMTGRVLADDLKEKNWPAYFSAFQLSVDILNGMTLLI